MAITHTNAARDIIELEGEIKTLRDKNNALKDSLGDLESQVKESDTEDLYSKNPITATMDEKLPEIIRKMQDNNIERIPIVDNKHIVKGIIVVSDIIRLLGEHLK